MVPLRRKPLMSQNAMIERIRRLRHRFHTLARKRLTPRRRLALECVGLEGRALLSGVQGILDVSGASVSVLNPVTGAVRNFSTANNFTADTLRGLAADGLGGQLLSGVSGSVATVINPSTGAVRTFSFPAAAPTFAPNGDVVIGLDG
jgi:hypothetical protein